jgi:site-specific DNA-methyltransferase (adenine-specific)/modification methylase
VLPELAEERIWYEDELPQFITDEQYDEWFKSSFVDGVRMGKWKLPKVDLVLTDPPYGINMNTDYETTRQRARKIREQKGDRHAWGSVKHPPIHGDDKPFDPAFLLTFKKLVLFGANNYAERLPNQYSWIVWDKKTERGAKNNWSDCELAWCRGGSFNSVRIFRHMWAGYQRDSEVGEKVLHPTQKPMALMKWIISSFYADCETILDPYMGSGTTLRAAKDLGRKAIGIEISEEYCRIAVNRLRQEVLSL